MSRRCRTMSLLAGLAAGLALAFCYSPYGRCCHGLGPWRARPGAVSAAPAQIRISRTEAISRATDVLFAVCPWANTIDADAELLAQADTGAAAGPVWSTQGWIDGQYVGVIWVDARTGRLLMVAPRIPGKLPADMQGLNRQRVLSLMRSRLREIQVPAAEARLVRPARLYEANHRWLATWSACGWSHAVQVRSGSGDLERYECWQAEAPRPIVIPAASRIASSSSGP